jgi:raffinose/stachyose/melibiose transport system substrate-binding protein
VKRPVLAIGIAVAAAVAVALTGCTGAAPTAKSAAGNGKSVVYSIGQPDTPAELASIKADLANFTKESGVKVTLRVIPNNSSRTLIQTQLRSGNGPDVFQYDTGPGFAGVLANAGLLYNLTSHAQTAKWTVYNWARNTVTFNGKYYGIPDQIEEVGLFYNKDLFTQLGLQPPTTMAALETDAAAIKKAGKIPFAAGDKEGWEGGHLLSMALSSRVGPAASKSLVTNQSDWNSDGVKGAIATWADFVKQGYLPPSPNAITYDNSNALFYSGKAAMDPTGTWLIQDFPGAVKFNVGFVPFPSADGTGIASTDLGGGTFMSAGSKNTAAALKLMDYLVGQTHGTWELNHYLIPAFPLSTKAANVSPLFSQVIANTASYAKGSGNVGYNIDVNETDVFNKVMWDGMQGILNGNSTPADLASKLQAAAQKKTS